MNHSIWGRRISVLLILAVVLLPFTGCTTKPATQSRTGYYFNTMVTLTLFTGGSQAALDGAFELCAGYEKLFSRTDPDSALYALNHADGRAVAIDPELETVLRTACAWAERTGGRFDPTVAPLSDLWDFGNGGRLPAAEEIAAALPCVGYQNVVFSDGCVCLQNGAEVDLGGIAKGYIGDRLREYLEEAGVTSGLIDLGGNIFCIGEKDGGRPFSVGIKNPENTADLSAVVEVSGQSVATSGGYERCFTADGVTYHHILDPATGMPAESDLASATVICAEGAQADLLSTICFLYGRAEALTLIESLPDTEAVFITVDGEIVYTSGIGENGIPITIR